jgi:predicted unusual protein kinase regulating ubiquinone biosynthesis (AarF/ABC1/UbiB family)
MSLVGGVPVEALVDAAQSERDRVMTLLFALLLREVFEFRLVQTDPNFANYRYDTDSGQLILLDFGATRPYKAAIANEFLRLLKGAIAGDRAAMAAADMVIGYFDQSTQERHREAILDMGQQAFEPFSHEGAYDFGATDLPARIRAAAMALGMDREFWQLPPADAMLLQRKFGGLYLLAIRLKARVNLHALVQAVPDSGRRKS